MSIYTLVSETLFLSEGSPLGPNQTTLSADAAKRKKELRYLRKIMLIGAGIGIVVSVGQLLANTGSRREIIAQWKNRQFKDIAKNQGKNIAIGMAGDYIADKTSGTLASKWEQNNDRKRREARLKKKALNGVKK